MNLEDLKEFQAFCKTVDYDNLMKMLAILLAENTKRMMQRALE